MGRGGEGSHTKETGVIVVPLKLVVWNRLGFFNIKRPQLETFKLEK